MEGLGQRTIEAREPIERTQDVYRAVIAPGVMIPANDPPIGQPAPGQSPTNQPQAGQGIIDSLLTGGFYLGDAFIPYWLIGGGLVALWLFSGKGKRR